MGSRRLASVSVSLLVVLLVGVAVSGCGSESEGAIRSEAADARSKGPKPEIPKGPTADELIVEDRIEGTGATADEGDLLAVHYVAGIYETGEEIESAWVPGDPLGFKLGEDDWAYGFEEGIPGMRVGGRRVLIYPTTRVDSPPGSKLGDTLVYVVDLVEARPPADDG
jgi:FKBP-type peptidyl-prolyl cis-trans isomerase